MGFEEREKKRSEKGGVAASMFSKEIRQGAATIGKEVKKRYNLSLLPSLYENFQKICFVERKSASEVISDFIADYVNKNKEKINEYHEIKE